MYVRKFRSTPLRIRALVACAAMAGAAVGALTTPAKAQSAGSCAPGYPTCFFDSTCNGRCFQSRCNTTFCGMGIMSDRDCSVCSDPI